MTPMRGLYPIVDLDTLATRQLGPLELAEAVLTARPHLLQLRAKHASPRDVLALLERLKPLCAKAGTALFANDRPDLAILAGAEGVHVGQDDLPIEAVRRLRGELKVGISTHNAAQLVQALALKPAYVAFGPIFATRSKERHEPVLGMQALLDAATLAARAQIPLVAIGGLGLGVAEELGKTGVIAAVISDLLLDGDASSAVAARARAWQAALTQAQ